MQFVESDSQESFLTVDFAVGIHLKKRKQERKTELEKLKCRNRV